MEQILTFVSKKGYKWPYLVLFTLATILYAVLCAISETKLDAFAYGTFFVMLYGYAYVEERIWR
jgi:hypothetical protein